MNGPRSWNRSPRLPARHPGDEVRELRDNLPVVRPLFYVPHTPYPSHLTPLAFNALGDPQARPNVVKYLDREVTPVGWFQRADYRWLLLADPPICRSGRADVVLNNCDLQRRGEVCWCRFVTQEAIEDVALVGAPGSLDDWLTAGDLDDDDVAGLRDTILQVAGRVRAAGELTDDLAGGVERLEVLAVRLKRLIDRGSGLSDRHADDVE